MAKGKINDKTNEIISGDKRQDHHDPWDADYGPMPTENSLEKILELPGIDDMAGVMSRSNFKNDDVRIAALRIVKRLNKFGLTSRIEFIRQCCASTIGLRAFGRTLQLQIGTNLIAPVIMREQLNMQKIKGEEQVSKGSDFRQEGDSKEPSKE